MQLTLGLLLGGFSAVQWVRNQPLVPKPLVATFRRTVNTAAESLGRPAVFTPAEVEVAGPDPTPAAHAEAGKAARAARLAALRPAAQPVAANAAPAAAAPDSAATLAAHPLAAPDSVGAAPGRPAAATERPAVAAAAASLASAPTGHLVRGHIFDQMGRPLAGATVLVKGTNHATVTNASGAYELQAPMGAVLLIGYAGYADEQATTGESTVMDATLEPVSRRDRRAQL